MKTRVAAPLLCIILAITLCSCDFITIPIPSDSSKSSSAVSVIDETSDSNSVIGVEKITPDSTEIDKEKQLYDYTTVKDRPVMESGYYTPADLTAGYNALDNDALKKCYDKLLAAVYSISDEKDSKGYYVMPQVKIRDEEVPQERIRLVIEALRADNPQIFWIMNSFGYAYDNGDTLIQLYSCQDSTYVQAAVDMLGGAVSTIIADVPGGYNEYEREKYVHNYLIDNCTYAEKVKSPDDSWCEFTAYGAITDGSAVCGGYSYAAQLLLKYLGITSVTVSGMGESDLHMWNQVKIDGLWYNLDITWSDNTEASRYDYFNLTDEVIGRSHHLSPMYSELDADEICGTENTPAKSFNIITNNCTTFDANFYFKESAVLTDFSSESDMEMVTRLAATAQAKNEYFSIYVDKANYSDALQHFFYDSPYKFFYYIDEANKLISVPIDNTGVSVIKKESLNVITVKLSYTN